jgi:DNA polymerase-3 subunit delta'
MKEKTKIIFPDWLDSPRQLLSGMLARGQLPQSLLLHGSAGLGRRLLALWLAAELLHGELERFIESADAEDDNQRLAHPDFLLLRPESDKSSISVDSVRELIAFLSLKSHQGGARVAVVWTADQLTHPAANSLLKVLEEPPGGSVIVLIAEHTSRLPATVLSRCHRLNIKPPARAAAIAWLNRQAENPDWETLLDFCGDAPLSALELHAAGFSKQAASYDQDMRSLLAQQGSPAAIARKWASGDLQLSLRWLHRYTCSAIRNGLTTAPDRSLQKPGDHLNMRRLFAFLQNVEHLRRNGGKAVNPELQLAWLLQSWYGHAPVAVADARR